MSNCTVCALMARIKESAPDVQEEVDSVFEAGLLLGAMIGNNPKRTINTCERHKKRIESAAFKYKYGGSGYEL